MWNVLCVLLPRISDRQLNFPRSVEGCYSIGRSRDAFVTYFERIILSIRRRVTFVWPPCRLRLSFRYKLLWKLTCSCCLRVWFGCHRVTFCRHRTCFGCWLAVDQVRGYLRPKFQIPYSCVHLVSTSGQCDASITKCTNSWLSSFIQYLVVISPFPFIRPELVLLKNIA